MLINRRLIFLFGLSGFLLFMHGCNIINPAEQTPTYIHVDSFLFDKNSAIANISTSHQITNMWVYYNGANVGSFDLPATIPIITNGNDSGTLEIAPGIVVDGLNDLLATYPFYTISTQRIKPQPGKILNILPETGYYNTIHPQVVAAFNGTTGFVQWMGKPIQTTYADSLVFEGLGSGMILLTDPGDSSIDSSSGSWPIPQGVAYLEFNYKTNIQFYVGMQTSAYGLSTSPYYLVGVSPSDHWQKFYMNMADFVANFPGNTYNFYIKASLPPGQATGKVLIDNVQILHF